MKKIDKINLKTVINQNILNFNKFQNYFILWTLFYKNNINWFYFNTFFLKLFVTFFMCHDIYENHQRRK